MVDSRLSYVDTAKFLAIWFVIISHSCMKSSICYFLFAFHVQLFFMLYGFVHKTKSNQSLMEYLIIGGKLLIYRVLLPFFSACIHTRNSNISRFRNAYCVWKHSIIEFYYFYTPMVSSLLFCGSIAVQFSIYS